MKKLFLLTVLTLGFTLRDCISRPTPPILSPTQSPIPAQVEPPTQTPPAASITVSNSKTYTDRAFGLAFQFPKTWYGPDEYVSDQTLRLAIGSDVVYPYGTDRSEQIYTLRNSYVIIIQYSLGGQHQAWLDTYQSLANLADGETRSDQRQLLMRVRQVKLGRFDGFEYISTLSESAQTEPFYARQVFLMDDRGNVLTMMGVPNNVDPGSGTNWRAVYQMIDQQNQVIFEQILASLKLQ